MVETGSWRPEGLRRATLFSLLVVAAVVAACYLFLDRPASEAALLLKHTPWHLWAERCSLLADHTVVFACIAVGLVVYALHAAARPRGQDPSPWARSLLCVCLAASVAVACVESVKVVFGRCRPQLLFEHGEYGFTWWSQEYLRNSFPSGHTTRIFSLAVAISLVSRRAALPALLVAVLVGASRVLALKHYPSDVLAGAWLGSVVACWTCFLVQRRRG